MTTTVDLPARYRPDPGREALGSRLRALLTAGVPARCGVYAGLAEPGPGSPNHARVTHTIARHLAGGTAQRLPWFNTSPPPVLRVLTAASWGREDALVVRPEDLPADLATDLWRAVAAMPADDRTTAPAELADLLIRLGFVKEAARVLGLGAGLPERFGTEHARTELATLSRLLPASQELLVLATRAAGDPRHPARQRIAFANFVMVRHGKRGKDSPLVDEAYRAGATALAELPEDDFDRHLARHTFHRAAAYVPFLRGLPEATVEHLDRAREEVLAARPGNEVQELALADHIFPLYETLARTYGIYGRLDDALAAARKLVDLSPWDYRTWFAHGQVLLRLGRWEESVAAHEKVYEIGGHPVGQAAYLVGFARERLGDRAGAADAYRLSQRVDPTAPVVPARLAGLHA